MFAGLRLSSSKFRYQSNLPGLPIFGFQLKNARSCQDRLVLIKKYLPRGCRNILDIGSNSGYYLFALAKLGYRCYGLEADSDLVLYAHLASYLLKAKGASCECGMLNLSFVERMPRYDVVLCLSVMHHIILREGLAAAEKILTGLREKANYALFFEMGQSNEIEADWSVRLPRMEPDPETWISQWLKQCGFSRVQTIGTSTTTVPRFLFAAYP